MKTRSARGMRPSRTSWMKEAAGCSWRRRRLLRAMAEQRPSLGRPGLRAARSFAARRISLLCRRPRLASGAEVPAGRLRARRPLLWVSKSREKLAVALRAMNHVISANTVAKMLVTLGYSRQVNRKTKEGSHHADRDGQFQHINGQAIAFQAAGQPVISVDTKKKELIGEYKNGGSDYRATGCPDAVKVHDFVDKDLGKVAPYGIYDIA